VLVDRVDDALEHPDALIRPETAADQDAVVLRARELLTYPRPSRFIELDRAEIRSVALLGEFADVTPQPLPTASPPSFLVECSGQKSIASGSMPTIKKVLIYSSMSASVLARPDPQGLDFIMSRQSFDPRRLLRRTG